MTYVTPISGSSLLSSSLEEILIGLVFIFISLMSFVVMNKRRKSENFKEWMMSFWREMLFTIVGIGLIVKNIFW